jgi:hypothetical protein
VLNRAAEDRPRIALRSDLPPSVPGPDGQGERNASGPNDDAATDACALLLETRR